MNKKKIEVFQAKIWNYYKEHGRDDLPWREDRSPYSIFISEIMLQQTQVERVKELFLRFIAKIPNFKTLATIDQPTLLSLWQGLGYNRRALYLKKAAQMIMDDFGGELPQNRDALKKLPGIGEATSGSILAYAFEEPVVYVETNIRALYIHEFFADRDDVEDSEIIPLAKAALPKDRVFDWYSALMDYGTYLKKSMKNPSRKSKHHSKQSKFEGSDRQIRGKIVKSLIAHEQVTSDVIKKEMNVEYQRVEAIFSKLTKEGFCIEEERGVYRIAQ